MLDEIQNDPAIYSLIRNDCHENGIGINFCDELFEAGEYIDPDKLVILKLDAFYDTKRMATPPKSPDYLIILRCPDNSYNLYVIELRNVSRTSGIPRADILEKFSTIVEDFFPNRFPNYFDTTSHKINNISFYLITDPYNLASRGLNSQEIREYLTGTNLDAYSSMEPLIYNGLPILIEPKLPNPTLCRCDEAPCN